MTQTPKECFWEMPSKGNLKNMALPLMLTVCLRVMRRSSIQKPDPWPLLIIQVSNPTELHMGGWRHCVTKNRTRTVFTPQALIQISDSCVNWSWCWTGESITCNMLSYRGKHGGCWNHWICSTSCGANWYITSKYSKSVSNAYRADLNLMVLWCQMPIGVRNVTHLVFTVCV